MIQIVRDMLAVNHLEKQLGRKLTEEEISGFKPIKARTQDGVVTLIYIEKIPFSYFFPEGSQK